MNEFSRKELLGYTIGGGACALIGLVLYLSTRKPPPPDDFWMPYVIAWGGVGALMAIFGLLWLVLGLARLQTRLFDEHQPIDSQQFGAFAAALAIVVVILLATVIPRLPKTAPNNLPPELAARSAVLRQEGNFRVLVGGFIVLAGAALAAVPARRFFRS